MAESDVETGDIAISYTGRSADDYMNQVQQNQRTFQQAAARNATKSIFSTLLRDPPYSHHPTLHPAQQLNFKLITDLLASIRTSDIPDVISSLGPEERNVMMKYLYQCMERPEDVNCAFVLSWHEKLVESEGVGGIMRVMTDPRSAAL